MDPFTLSAGGRPWPDVHWLFQLVAYGVYRLAGFGGLTVAKAAGVAATSIVLTRTAERSGGPVARTVCALALLPALFLARHLLPIRPLIVTLLFLSVFLYVLEGWRLGRYRGWQLLVLPAVQILWINCQGLAPLGIVLIVAYLLGGLVSPSPVTSGSPLDGRRHLQRLGGVLALSALASFATPFGLAAVRLPAELLSRITPRGENIFSSAIAENIPPLVLERMSPGDPSHLKWILLGLGAGLALLRPRIPPAHILVLATFLSLALMANRNVVLFYAMVPPLLAIATAPLASALLATPRKVRRVAAVAALLFSAEIGLGALAFAREPSIGQPTPFHFPVESARRLAAIGATGPIFAPEHHGGYLTFVRPELQPYIDTRLVLHTAAEYATYLALFDDVSSFDALASAQQFKYVVLTTTYPDRYLNLATHLIGDRTWKLLYTDGSELLFSREGSNMDLTDRVTIARVSAELSERFGDETALGGAARFNLARLLAAAREFRQAEFVLSNADTRAAALLRARARFLTGDLAAAESLTRILLMQSSETDADALALMAEIALAEHHWEDAREWVRKALAIDPHAPVAHAVVLGLRSR